MFRTSIDGKSLQANKALAQILGYKTAEDAVNNVNNSASQTWLYASDRLKYMELLDKHEVVNGFESRFKRIDGEIIWVSMNVKLIRGENAEKLYYEGFLEDITDRKHKELEIKKKMENLQWHYDIAIQRELKMVELKKEINELLVKLGKEKKY